MKESGRGRRGSRRTGRKRDGKQGQGGKGLGVREDVVYHSKFKPMWHTNIAKNTTFTIVANQGQNLVG